VKHKNVPENKRRLSVLIAKQKSETQIPERWKWVETSIWTERMLATLDNGVKGGKWFSLWDKVIRLETLQIAWKYVKRNKGAAGIDGVTIKQFETSQAHLLTRLHTRLKEGSYNPQLIKRVHIPKDGGKTRPLGIASVEDRVVQTALKMVLEPIFEKEFLSNSYGFRPARNAKDALREVDQLLKTGYAWYVDADIQNYFDTIPKQGIMEQIKARISDGRVLELIQKCLEQGVMEDGKEWQPTQGTVQGSPLSPLLSNLYLHSLDKEMSEKGYKWIRFADDSVAICNSGAEAETILNEINEWMNKNGLTLHPDKTRIGNCRKIQQGFDFLGYHFERGRKTVRKKSVKKLRDKIRSLTKRTVGKSVKRIITVLNPTLRGWFNYFKHVDTRLGDDVFRETDGFVRRRLRAILRKHEKSPSSGRCLNDHMRWPNKFFASLGLFDLNVARMTASQSHC
jgi:RNA-directed DNA polymerase